MALTDAFKSIDVQLGAIELVASVLARTQILKFHQPHTRKQKPKTSIIAQMSAKAVDSFYARIIPGFFGCFGVLGCSGVFRSVPVFRSSGVPGFSTCPLIEAKPEVRNLGAWFDSHLNMSLHISKLCASAFYHLYNI